MKELLFIDACIRGAASRTARLGRAFLDHVDRKIWNVTVLHLTQEALQPLTGDFFLAREALLEAGDLDHPRFRYARQFARADAVVMAAPFWDLSIPALLKIYIENISLDGITFRADETGCHGACRGSDLIFLTTRGGVYGSGPMEQGSRYLEALKDFFGFRRYTCVAAEGLDCPHAPVEALLREACTRAAEAAAGLTQS